MADFRALPDTMSRRLLTPTVWLSMITVDAFTQAATPIPPRVVVQRLGQRPVLLISGSDPEERDANRA
jgi:hypothetical protein